MAGFSSFNVAPGTSAEDLAERRKLAYLLMQQGSSGEPIASPWQGVNRIAQALVGGYDAYDIDRKQKAEKKEASDLIGEALGTTQTSSAPPQFGPREAPAAPPPSAPAPRAIPDGPLSQPPATQGAFPAAGRDYSPSAPAPAPAAAAPAAAPAAGVRQTRFAPTVEQAIAGAAQEFGVDPNLMRTFAQIESSGRPDEMTGSHAGLYQMSPTEWAKFGGGGDIMNPVDNARGAAIKLKAESTDFEEKYGRPPSATDLYLVHQQGAGGYDKHVGNPNGLAWQNMLSTAEGQQKGKGWARAAIWGNVPDDMKAKFGSVDNVTSGEFYKMWDGKVGRTSAQFSGGGAPAAAVAAADPNAPTGAAAGTNALGIDPAMARAIQKLSSNQYSAPWAQKLLEVALAKPQYTTVAPGASVIDPRTGRVVYQAPEKSGHDAYALAPTYWEDKDGNVHISQLSKAGGQRPVTLPDGARWLPGVETKDIGTSLVNINRRSGQQVGEPIPKDIVGKESAEEVGKAQGIARVALPQVTTATNRLMDVLEHLDKDPMRSAFTGYAGYLPTVSPAANSYKAYLDQLQGGTFLQVFADLRGGGAITDIEGKKGTAALVRLQTIAPSDEGYQAALDDARDTFKGILDNVRQRAGVSEEQAPKTTGRDMNAQKTKYGLDF